MHSTYSIGYVVGSFDLYNIGDLDLIAQAGASCDTLVVGVRSDDDVQRQRGRRPVISLEERVEILRHVRGIADVVVHDDADLDALGVDVLFAVPDDAPEIDTALPVVEIVPARRSASRQLRDALRSVPQESVA